MVSVQHSIANLESSAERVDALAGGLDEAASARIAAALDWVEPLYRERSLGTGETIWNHALGMALICVSLRLDLETRLAALLFAVGDLLDEPDVAVSERFGVDVTRLVAGLRQLNGLRLLTRATLNAPAPEVRSQTEVLRKMVLALVEDVRVVLLRLASRTQTLRYFTEHKESVRLEVARESMDLYAPLANRLGVWQLKWELEDLSFRFLEPETYKRIAKMLDERRVEREAFIQDSIARLSTELATAGIRAEVYGRPKHIFSIYNKMRAKHLDFAQVYDVRALRVLVGEVDECYAALSIVHALWTPIANEFDDYILKPKGNDYQSLHTAVRCADGRALEVQIRTYDMHRHAELGVAAHWRYKEGSPSSGTYDDKIALLRQLLTWRDEVTDSADWLAQYKQAELDDTVYVLTPQGKVIDLPQGATPIDFAYRLHTDLGHRCRGARVDGQMVSLDTPLANGQKVEIVTTKQGGPSRDWLNPQLGYLVTSNARAKVRRWFVQQEEAETMAQGRAIVQRELQREGQREGHSPLSVDELARKLDFRDTEALYLAVGRGDVGLRQIHNALHEAVAPVTDAPELTLGRSRSSDSNDKILIVGVGKLLTTLSRCCKPVPSDAIVGFVTRGRGVSIHRADCRSFLHLSQRHPERIVPADWGSSAAASGGKERQEVYPVDIAVEALDRQGLLRDISDVFSREKLNVVAVNTVSKAARAYMRFTVEVAGMNSLQRALTQIGEVSGVVAARRA